MIRKRFSRGKNRHLSYSTLIKETVLNASRYSRTWVRLYIDIAPIFNLFVLRVARIKGPIVPRYLKARLPFLIVPSLVSRVPLPSEPFPFCALRERLFVLVIVRGYREQRNDSIGRHTRSFVHGKWIYVVEEDARFLSARAHVREIATRVSRWKKKKIFNRF